MDVRLIPTAFCSFCRFYCLSLVFGLAFLRADATFGEEPILLDCKELTESSGLAVSGHAPILVWTHNDSGNKPRLYLFSALSGWLQGIFELADTKATDWEDLCSFELDGKHYLAIGDIGDNRSKRKNVSIHVIVEPTLDSSTSQLRVGQESPKVVAGHHVLTYDVTYPDGPVDCEALVFDREQSRFLLLTKELAGCRIFSVPVDLDAIRSLAESRKSKPVAVEAIYVQRLGIPIVTGADISPDGQTLVVCTYGPAYLLPRDAELWNQKNTKKLPLPQRKQGEAICFAGPEHVWVTSEKAPTPLWSVELKDEK